VSLVMNAFLLAFMLPTMGLIGAALALVIARTVEAAYLSRQTAKAYSTSERKLVQWSDIGKVALAAALASITLIGSFWTSTMGLFGVLAAGCCFMLVYVLSLLLLRLPEALLLKERLQLLGAQTVGRALARLRMSD